MRKVFFFMLLTLGLAPLAPAQGTNAVHWTFETKKIEANVYDLMMHAKIDPGWHLYSQEQPIEFGPFLPEFEFEPKANKPYELVGKPSEKGKAIIKYDEGFEGKTRFYEGSVSFVQRIKLTAPTTAVKGAFTVQVCKEGTCTLNDNNFSFAVDYEEPASKQGAAPDTKQSGDATPKGKPAEASSPSAEPDANTEGSLFERAKDLPAEGNATPEPDKAQWDIRAERVDDETIRLVLTAEIEEGWHIYGPELPKEDLLLVKTQVSLPDGSPARLKGELTTNAKVKEVYDETIEAKLPEIHGRAVFHQYVAVPASESQLAGIITFQTCSDSVCLIPVDKEFTVSLKNLPEATVQPESPGDPEEKDKSLWGIFIASFLSGLVALITPCVFPMIPLTVSFFTKQSGKKSKTYLNALIFGLSIIAIYVGVGLLLTIIFGPSTLQEMASNMWLNLAFFIIFMIFAISFFGAFEITLPSSWANKADQRAEKGGIIGIFFMAFTLTIVSFSCTGPIVSTLLFEAATEGGYRGPIAGMTGFSAAFALPFMIFAVFPGLMQSLPKSGGWLNSVKVVLGFVELALALKFLSNVDLVNQWYLLPRELFIGIWIIIALMLGFYLLGKIRFSHDSPLEYISVPRMLLALTSFAFALYMIPGMLGASLPILSGIAPPLNYSNLPEGGIFAQHPVNENKSKAEEEIELAENGYFAVPGITTYFKYEQAVRVAKELKRPILIDYTGFYCTNCRQMEEEVWHKPQISKKLNNEFVVLQLYGDDRKNELPKDMQFPSEVLDRWVDTWGEYNSHFFQKKFGSNAMPTYAIISPDGEQLVPLKNADLNVKSYAKWLDSGLEAFEERETSNVSKASILTQ